MAAKMIFPERKVVAVCGNSGFMMNSQELETAVRLKLDLVVIIVNDGGYGMIKWKQQHMEFADFGLDFSNPDFVKYAECYGACGHRVTRAAEFRPLLRGCVSSNGVHPVEVLMDYSENITELRPSAYAKYEEKQILDAPLVAPQLTVVFEQRYRNLPGPLCSSDIAPGPGSPT
jgi:thiamine pyrophosphate-dependent acetolactate synthase large subunit-like protein